MPSRAAAVHSAAACAAASPAGKGSASHASLGPPGGESTAYVAARAGGGTLGAGARARLAGAPRDPAIDGAHGGIGLCGRGVSEDRDAERAGAKGRRARRDRGVRRSTERVHGTHRSEPRRVTRYDRVRERHERARVSASVLAEEARACARDRRAIDRLCREAPRDGVGEPCACASGDFSRERRAVHDDAGIPSGAAHASACAPVPRSARSDVAIGRGERRTSAPSPASLCISASSACTASPARATARLALAPLAFALRRPARATRRSRDRARRGSPPRARRWPSSPRRPARRGFASAVRAARTLLPVAAGRQPHRPQRRARLPLGVGVRRAQRPPGGELRGVARVPRPSRDRPRRFASLGAGRAARAAVACSGRELHRDLLPRQRDRRGDPRRRVHRARHRAARSRA